MSLDTVILHMVVQQLAAELLLAAWLDVNSVVGMDL